MDQSRNSNYELLRILSMISIIALHIFRHTGNGELLIQKTSINQITMQLLCSWGLVGTDLFIILSAFFLLDSDKVKMRKLVQIIIMTSSYSVLAYIVSCIMNGAISCAFLLKALVSPLTGSYWFITAYLVMYLIHPLLNNIFRRLDEYHLRRCVLFAFGITFFINICLWRHR